LNAILLDRLNTSLHHHANHHFHSLSLDAASPPPPGSGSLCVINDRRIFLKTVLGEVIAAFFVKETSDEHFSNQFSNNSQKNKYTRKYHGIC
jgi:hypothetical protein